MRNDVVWFVGWMNFRIINECVGGRFQSTVPAYAWRQRKPRQTYVSIDIPGRDSNHTSPEFKSEELSFGSVSFVTPCSLACLGTCYIHPEAGRIHWPTKEDRHAGKQRVYERSNRRLWLQSDCFSRLAYSFTLMM